MIFRARQFEYTFPRPALVMGIVNVTPDSFSDGGQFLQPNHAIDHALGLVNEGADILDLGAESTRPHAEPVSETEELNRLLPVLKGLAGRVQVPISIDTTKPAVAQRCLDAGASIINDVAAHRTDPAMWKIVAAASAGYVVVHMQGTPQNMQTRPQYHDVVADIGLFFADRMHALGAAGVPAEAVVLDVGIGFGKTSEHNLRLLASLRTFTKWDRPVLLGVSRKSFIGQVTAQSNPAARLPGSLACACWAAGQGVNIVRAHDVTATREALRMVEAIAARSP